MRGHYLFRHVVLVDTVPDMSTGRVRTNSHHTRRRGWEWVDSPVRGNLDSLDPVTASAVRPAPKFDVSIVDDSLLVKREYDGAPAHTISGGAESRPGTGTDDTGMFWIENPLEYFAFCFPI